MDKNTILAIILTSVIITVGMLLTQYVNEKNVPPSVASNYPPSAEAAETPSAEPETPIQEEKTAPVPDSAVSGLPEQNFEKKRITEETNLFRIVFNTVGGVALDIDLLAEFDNGMPISMVLDGDKDSGTFNLAFGGPDAPYLQDVFEHKRVQRGKQIIHNFSRKYRKEDRNFTLTKSYRIIPDEYLIELIVKMKSDDGKAIPALGSQETAYTLTYGPQIGPTFEKIDGRYEIRDFVSWGPDPRSGKIKRKTYRDRSKIAQINNTISWAGVIGKYFAVIATPGSGQTTITWDGRPVEGQEQASRLQISKPDRRKSVIEDTYRYYIGPLNKGNLLRYNNGEDNAFGISGMDFQHAPRSSSWLGWLESILRFFLEKFYLLIPNYGIAIILLTILVKIVLYPFTHKSYESTSRMQALQPKIKELQERHKGDPRKLNAKMGELYKSEKVNPMSGCLPMLFQLPIFIALYGLLNRFFPLRGASFIPGWITDLSAPEFIWKEFEKPLNLLIIDIPAIRILPILYLAGQFLLTKVTQQAPSSAQSAMQQKMFTVFMPIMLFFILYNMPSGLLLYWTVMNFISIGQQLVTNSLKKRKALGVSK